MIPFREYVVVFLRRNPRHVVFAFGFAGFSALLGVAVLLDLGFGLIMECVIDWYGVLSDDDAADDDGVP
jgi:hypothetical protein